MATGNSTPSPAQAQVQPQASAEASAAQPKTPPIVVKLPTKKTQAKQGLEDLIVIFYGPSKFGKTELAAQMDKAIFLPFEPGQNHVSVYKTEDITSWEYFLAVGREIKTQKVAGNFQFTTLVFDTIDKCYQLCRRHVLTKNGLVHETDLGFGKGYDLVNKEFERVITNFAQLGFGMWMLGHDDDKEVVDYFGKKVTKTVPKMGKGCREIILHMADAILLGAYAYVVDLREDESNQVPRLERVIRTLPKPEYEAGDRTGRLVDPLPVSWSGIQETFRTKKSPFRVVEGVPAPGAGAVKSSSDVEV